MTITETADTAGATPYVYSLTAAFRKLVGGGSALPPSAPHPMILLGGPCGGASGIGAIGSATLRVYGDAFINTADGAGCQALKIDGGGGYSAGSTSILAGGTCFAGAGLVCPPYTSYSPTLTDPFGSLVAPSTAGMTSRPNMCGSSGAQTAQPGVYAAAFSPGGGAVCTLASGIYVFQNGFNTGGGGVTIQSAPGGVLIYVTGGAINIAGGSTLTLSAMTTGTYAASGVTLWQAAADTTTITLSGDATTVIDGALYAPKAQLAIAGGSHAPRVSVVVVRTIDLSNDGHLIIGAPSAVPLSIGTTSMAWTVNRPYVASLGATGGDGQYKWTVTGALPSGLTFNANSGTVSGTPTAAGAFSVTFKLNDALGDDPDTQVVAIAINAAPVVTTASPLPTGEISDGYLAANSGTGGTAPLVWSATNLPAGLAINALNGALTGTPTGASGPSTIAVTVTDNAGATSTKNLSITLTAAPTITTTALAAGEQTVAGYTTPMAGSLGTTPYSWSATNLPAGLTINAGTGTIAGTPTSAAATSTVTVTLTDAVGAVVTKDLVLNITSGPAITTSTLASWDRTIAGYTTALDGTGGTTAYVWSATGLPTGLTMSSSTGTISGTPSGAAGTATVVVKITDAKGAVVTKTLSLVINALPSISTTALAGGEISAPYSMALVERGRHDPAGLVGNGTTRRPRDQLEYRHDLGDADRHGRHRDGCVEDHRRGGCSGHEEPVPRRRRATDDYQRHADERHGHRGHDRHRRQRHDRVLRADERRHVLFVVDGRHRQPVALDERRRDGVDRQRHHRRTDRVERAVPVVQLRFDRSRFGRLRRARPRRSRVAQRVRRSYGPQARTRC